ncbi:hypothetical protein [Nocardia salmonicida]|uniref:hypothetical protein n=1 Tax=Nocardia salmonicida TaxID=53431 RepID=UPI0033C4C516
MTTATTPVPTHRPAVRRNPRAAHSAITRLRNTVCALPAPTLPHDTVRATTVDDLATVDIIDSHTLAVVARRDRHIRPIAALISQQFPELTVTVTVIHSAILVCTA